MASTLTHLQCSRATCGNVLPHTSLQNLCPLCKSPLLARYDLDAARGTLSLEALHLRERTMWRYAEVLPGAPVVTLGEGMTPLIHARRLGERLGLDRFYIKEFEADTNLRLCLVLDSSGSMAFGKPGYTRFDFARKLCGTLAFLAAHLEFDAPGHLGEQGVVGPDADVDARMPLCAALAHEDVAGEHALAAESLHAEALAL